MEASIHLTPTRRRSWLRFVALVGVGCLTSCENGGEHSPFIPKAEEAKKVVILSWDHYFDESVLADFTKATGIEVTVQTYESTAEMLEKLKSEPQKYDVLVTEGAEIPNLRLARILAELDHEQLPNLKNLDPRHLQPSYDRENEFTLPYMWGTTLLAYRKDKLGEAPKSWKLLLDERVKGRAALLDERNECFFMTSTLAGYCLGVAQDSETKKASLAAGGAMLERLIEQQEAVMGSDNEMKEFLITGRVWVAQMYSGDAALISQEHPNIGYFIPEEGASIWMDNFAVVRDSVRQGRAHQFLDFMMSAEIAARSSNYLRYASPNAAAHALLDPALKEDPAIYPPPQVLRLCQQMPSFSPEDQRLMNGFWRKVKAALRGRSDVARQNS